MSENLQKLIEQKISIKNSLSDLEKKYLAEKSELLEQLKEIDYLEQLTIIEVNLDLLKKGKKIIEIFGNPDIKNDSNEIILEIAKEDIVEKCKILKLKRISNKKYSGYHQRCDMKVGFQPKHGTITDYIKLLKHYDELTTEDINAALYYMHIYSKIKNL